MMNKPRFWVEEEAIKMVNDKWELNALGVYGIGYILERLEWAIAATQNPAQLAPYFGILRGYEQVSSLEDIGREAKYYHDMLSSYEGQTVSREIKDNLRDARARWDALVRERIQGLYLVTPKSIINPKCLWQGIVGMLSQERFSLLKEIEVSDLNEACRCIVFGSATAAEHIALRAAESLLRRWYEYKTNKKIIYRTWGTVLNKLAREYPENGRPKEITLLGYLKQRRDEVAHPDRVSSLVEAEATLMNVCSLLEGITSVLVTAPLPIPDIQLAVPEPEVLNLKERAARKKKGVNSGEPAVGD